MKQTTISVNVYEVGDILQVNSKDFKLVAKQRDLDGSKRVMVIGVKQRLDKMFTYKVVTDKGVTLQFTPSEQGNEEYVGHIDLGMLMGSVKANAAAK